MKLPPFVWSQLGAIAVKPKPIAPTNPDMNPDFGEWDAGMREITVNSATCKSMQIATLLHEMTHVALWDAGGSNVLSDAQTEFVCDALGSYLAGALLAGYLKIAVPKNE